MNLFDLTGRVAIVSGASGWLGGTMVEALAGHGASVVAVGRDESRLRAALSGLSGDISLQAADVTTPAWPELIARTGRERGRIDVLVNNAHVGRGGSLRGSTAADFHEALDLAVVSTSAAIEAARPWLTEAARDGSPSVVNVASMYGLVAPDPSVYDREEQRNPPYYGAAKAALVQLTRYAAAELGPLGVRVNAIAPGPFPGPAAQEDEPFVRRLASRTMLGRVGSPAEVATALLYLASPHSSFTTGSVTVVDGGWTAW